MQSTIWVVARQTPKCCIPIPLATTIATPNPSPFPSTPKIRTYRNLPIARMRSFQAARSSRVRPNTGMPNARRATAHNAIHANATATPATTGRTKSRMTGFYLPIPQASISCGYQALAQQNPVTRPYLTAVPRPTARCENSSLGSYISSFERWLRCLQLPAHLKLETKESPSHPPPAASLARGPGTPAEELHTCG